jgi:hypothetical protein
MLVASVLAAVVGAVLLGLAVPVAAAALPTCPTQKQLQQRGATAAEVSSAPQESTGTFPVAPHLTVPDEQCSYQGTLGLLLAFWQISNPQQAAAKQHFAYECKLKSCTIFLARGVNVVATSSGGKMTTRRLPTLTEVVLNGKVSGEASTANPPPSSAHCDELARTLYSFLTGVGPRNTPDILEEATCP